LGHGRNEDRDKQNHKTAVLDRSMLLFIRAKFTKFEEHLSNLLISRGNTVIIHGGRTSGQRGTYGGKGDLIPTVFRGEETFSCKSQRRYKLKILRVLTPLILLIAILLSSCDLSAAASPAEVAPQTGFTATALMQTIQALSTQNKLLLPTTTPDITNTPTQTEKSTPTATLTPSSTQTPTLTPIATQVGIPVVYVTSITTYYPYGAPYYNYRYPYNYQPTFPGYSRACNRAWFISDVTIPDHTVLGAGSLFVKTWRISNAGSCTWNSSYKFIFSSGSSLSAPSSVNLPNSVAPGHTVDISVSMVTPTSNGTYTGYWMLESDSGAIFGVGLNGNTAVYVLIVVN